VNGTQFLARTPSEQYDARKTRKDLPVTDPPTQLYGCAALGGPHPARPQPAAIAVPKKIANPQGRTKEADRKTPLISIDTR
jgi:hypothetical protein